jgi:hypothetical protein
VFKDAAAVFNVDAIGNAGEAISHIADAQRRQSHPNQPLPSPGVFKMLEGSQAVADPASTGSNALQRLQNESKQNSNRYKSCRKDNPNAIINDRRPINASDSCKKPGGVVNTSPPCSCDEYPFASTWQGASTTGVERVSAKYILAAENNAAGGGAYKGKLLHLRVIDFTDHSVTDSMDPQNDNFWVWKGPINVPR